MPINPTSARSVVKLRLFTDEIVKTHTHSFYLDCSCVRDVDGIITLQGVVDPTTTNDWLLHDVIEQMYARIGLDRAADIPAITILDVQVWQNETDPLVETFIGYDLSDYSDVVGQPSLAVGAASVVWSFQSADKSNWRWTVFDGTTVLPARVPQATPPDTDDGSFIWFIIKSNVPFATNDGEGITRAVNKTYGHNKELADQYGYDYNVTLL